ncbi:hypothetical protein [Ancylobacter lacus]|uniref:hypothetical protein n=1 Tax=Ancylobacter lacus TaxID=2579970 RepID=UPI001BCDEA6B|nr:hypothetical protein [Ancylobacter lacus]MBS7541369.1 hypothetical protein [Ancylobacter lacus]
MFVLFRLLFVLAVVVVGYWLYYIFVAVDPYDPIGVAINERMPQPMRELSCVTLHRRHPGVLEPPSGCAHLWVDKL